MRKLKIITIGGTEGKRELSAFLQEWLPGSCLLALEDTPGTQGQAGPHSVMLLGSELEKTIEESDLIPEDGTVLLESNSIFVGLEPALSLFYADGALEGLPREMRDSACNVDMVLLEVVRGPGTPDEAGLERSTKEWTGASKVLIFGDRPERERVFRKVLDVACSRLGGNEMPDDIESRVIEAVKREAAGGRMTCERAHELARELGVPLEDVGRALDLQGIKITKCQLGCF